MPGVILVVAALILVNAIYVAAEFAAVSVRRSRIQQLAADGHDPRVHNAQPHTLANTRSTALSARLEYTAAMPSSAMIPSPPCRASKRLDG